MKKQKLHHILRTARKKQGLTQRDVQRLTRNKVSNGHLCQLEKGITRHPNPEILRALAKVLRLDFLSLMIMTGHVTREELL